MEEVLVPISFFTFSFGAIYIFVSTRHRERMAMIEKGIEIEFKRNTNFIATWSIKIGLLLMGVALGILIGHIITNVFYSSYHHYDLVNNYMRSNEEVVIIPLCFFFGGLALFISYFIERKILNSNSNQNLLNN